jgi:hypothetical protein
MKSCLEDLEPIESTTNLTESSGYACYTPVATNFAGQACASLILSETTTTVTNASNNEPILATLHPQTEAVNGYGVSIRYQSTDFTSSTYSSGSSTSSATSSSSSSATAAASPGISTGAKAGIGVGAAVVGLAVLVGIAMLFLARRRKARSSTSGDSKPELDGADVPLRYEAPGELAMAQKKRVQEIYTPPAELGGVDVARR